MSTPFSGYEPIDGYRAELQEGDALSTLSLKLYVDGEPANDRVVCHARAGKDDPEGQFQGSQRRSHLMLQALCRYFNAGGTWYELNQLTDDISGLVSDGFQVAGWFLVDCYENEAGNRVNVWAEHGTDRIVRWVENEFIDELTRKDLAHEELEEELEGVLEDGGGWIKSAGTAAEAQPGSGDDPAGPTVPGLEALPRPARGSEDPEEPGESGPAVLLVDD